MLNALNMKLRTLTAYKDYSRALLALAATATLVTACASEPDPPGFTAARPSADASTAAPGQAVSADEVEVVAGVADRGRDPAVIAIDIAGEALCSGTLISSRVVLTARHCVSETTESVDCPSKTAQIGSNRAAHTLGILSGDDVSHATLLAYGASLVVPSSNVLCDEDIAFIVLDRDVKGIKPLAVRASGIAKGDHVRAVGYGKTGDNGSAGTKMLRDHVPVLSVTAHEFEVGEATCNGDSGGPAIDDDTGDVVGVVSRGGPTCDGADVHNIYTRADAFLSLVNEALKRSGEAAPISKTTPSATQPSTKAPTSTPPKEGTPAKPASDIGGACTTGADCAAGVCVNDGTKQYCSRTCGDGDRCPTHYKCTASSAGDSVCVQST